MSITTVSQPYGSRCSAMNRALSSTSASVTVVPKQSQLFQPIGGRDVVGDTGTLAPRHMCGLRSATTEDRLYACSEQNAAEVFRRHRQRRGGPDHRGRTVAAWP